MTSRVAALAAVAAAAAACRSEPRRSTDCQSPTSGTRAAECYLVDAAFRRAELVASLVNPQNRYSRLRLIHYASGDAHDWERLVEWNPPVDVITPAELDAPGGASLGSMSSRAAALSLPDTNAPPDRSRLLSLGREAFRRYPVQLAPYWRVALASRASAAKYGLWVDEERSSVGGLVRARMADGQGALMVTCSTCHAAPHAGVIEDGLPNADLDSGAALLDASGRPDSDPPAGARVAVWGPGRLDVTTTSGTEPARIPDLRPVRWLTYLQQAAGVRARNVAALAIRIETLIITAHNEVTRPPRVVSLALAMYLESLGDALPSIPVAASANPLGSGLFSAQCASCHAPPGLTGEPVALVEVGTDPTLGESVDRATGAYRVPSLRGVGTRGPLLHDGTIPSLAAMFDPSRITSASGRRLHGSGAVPGHLYGLDLDAADRRALVSFLSAL